MMSKATDIRCPVCDSTEEFIVEEQPQDYEYFLSPPRRLSVHHCESCRSLFLWPRPTPIELVSFYPSTYHAYNEDHGTVARWLVGMRAKRRAQQLLKLAGREPVRLFDVGTGDCRHFADMRLHGAFDCSGVEINPEMVQKARETGYEVHQGTLEDLDISELEGRFDVVTMYQLLEHVESPARVLEKAFRLLRPGGSVLGQLPCADSFERALFGRYWAGYHYPRHLQAFTREGLKTVLLKVGFENIAIQAALHLQAGLSLQNWIVGNLPHRLEMKYGKIRLYSLLLLAVAPYCIIEYLLDRAGMMDFRTQRPI